MSMTMKRNWHLIVIAVLFLFVLCYFGTISVNIWNKWEITTDYFDIENTIDLFDTTQVHEIKILMTKEEYQDMIDTYANTSEKDWYKTDIIIDGVLISDVWVRLKWNSSLRWFGNWGGWPSISWIDRGKKWWFGSGNNRMWWFHGNMERWDMKGWFPWWMSWFNFSGDMKFPWAFEWWSFWPWMMSGDSIDYNSQLPLFIKFNKYTDQTYQWHTMISLRVGGMWSDETLLAEPYSYELYQEAWQPAPESSYWAVQIDWLDEKLFIISELPEDEYYVQKWFGDDNGILYKAWNFVDFSYQWEDPTLYFEYFTQKTRVNDYDLAPLIRMLKFVTESDDEEFEQEIDSYIDVESVLTLLAIDSFVWNNDSFGGMWSNYYLYYHLWEQKFYLLTWDQNLAFGWMGGWFGWGGFWWGNFGWMSWFNMWSWMNPSVISTQSEANEEKSTSNIKDDTTIDFSAKPRNDDSNTSKKDRNNTQMPSDFPVGEQWWFPWMDAMSFWTEGEESKNDSLDSSVTSFPQNDRNNMQMPPDFNWWEMPSNFPWWDTKNGKGGKWFGMWSNTLKTRLLVNEKFKAMYDEIYAKIGEIALNSDFSENFFNEWTSAFSDYDGNEKLVSPSSYSQWVEKLKSYLENKKSS